VLRDRRKRSDLTWTPVQSNHLRLVYSTSGPIFTAADSRSADRGYVLKFRTNQMIWIIYIYDMELILYQY
jgi:hypothetical protein